MLSRPLADSSPSNRLRWLPYLFAAGAVFWLIQLTQFAAVLTAPAGREQLQQTLANAGFASNAAALVNAGQLTQVQALAMVTTAAQSSGGK